MDHKPYFCLAYSTTSHSTSGGMRKHLQMIHNESFTLQLFTEPPSKPRQVVEKLSASSAPHIKNMIKIDLFLAQARFSRCHIVSALHTLVGSALTSNPSRPFIQGLALISSPLFVSVLRDMSKALGADINARRRPRVPRKAHEHSQFKIGDCKQCQEVKCMRNN